MHCKIKKYSSESSTFSENYATSMLGMIISKFQFSRFWWIRKSFVILQQYETWELDIILCGACSYGFV